MAKKKVFVYGSLKQGYGNHPLIATGELLGEHITEPKYTMYSLGSFPAVTLRGDTGISGEVYAVDDETFARLDRLEGYPHFYDRTVIDTPHGEAWMYFLEREEGNEVEGGVW